MSSTSIFKDKNVLITGGTGCFGKALARKLIQENQCNKVIIFSRDEWKQWEMPQSDPLFSHKKMRYFIGDVRDTRRMERAFNDVHYIIHTAALTHASAAEYNPSEYVNTNVLGGMNLIDVAINVGVEKIIALSSEKAVNPVSLFGATKLCSDKLFVAGNAYVGARGYPKLSVVRFGQLIESRDGLLLEFKKLLAEKASYLPVYDKKMTHFWITNEDAVNFVMRMLERMMGGEIFVPKLPSFRVRDLAKALAPELPQKDVGISERDRLHDLLISVEDARHSLDMGDHYIILPEIYTHDSERLKKFLNGRQGKKLPDGFAYSSEANDQWLEVDQLRELAKTMD